MVNTLYLPELRLMLAANNEFELNEFCTALNPARTAEFMEGLDPDESWQVLRHADLSLREQIFAYLSHDKQVAIIESQDQSEIAELLTDLPADDRVDLLHDVSPDKVEQLLPLFPTEERREIIRLRAYPENTAGSMMTTEVAMLAHDLTIREAFTELSRQAEHLETVYYIYVVDETLHLKGVVSTRQMVTAFGKPQVKLGDLMETDMVTVRALDDREEVARTVEKYDLLAIPVVDDRGHLLGIITHDDVMDVVREEHAEDVQRIGAIAPLEEGYMKTGLLTLSWKRGVWLTILFVTAMFTASALRMYEERLSHWYWLVMFIPLIMSSGGNSGNQSATLVIAALSAGELGVKDWRRVLWREIRVSLLLGTLLAAMGFIVSALLTWNDKGASQQAFWPLVVPTTLVLVVMCGSVAGSLLPLLFKGMGLDPALMSNPFVAALSDILAILIYMSVSILLLGVTESG